MLINFRRVKCENVYSAFSNDRLHILQKKRIFESVDIHTLNLVLMYQRKKHFFFPLIKYEYGL